MPIAAGQLAILFYHPHDLTVASELDPSRGLLVFFGESKIRSAISSAIIERELGQRSLPRKVVKLDGTSWNPLHFYQLALLNGPLLRPDRDVVAIEVSATTLNESAPPDRLGVIRPDTVREIASIPGLDTEVRLELLTGTLAPVYRYRGAIQNDLIWPKIVAGLDRAGPLLERVGLLDHNPRADFWLVPIEEDGGEVFERWAYHTVGGDEKAFKATALKKQNRIIADMRVGGPKVEALRRAVRVLRDRGLRVYLIQLPVDSSFAKDVMSTEAGQRFAEAVTAIADETGAILLKSWPDHYRDPNLFFDRDHLTLEGSRIFSRDLASILAPALPL